MRNIITISAPSGSGKTTLCKALQSARPDIEWSVSCTTREPRQNEINEIDYYFISNEVFMKHVADNAFAEWEDVHGQYYGTLKSNLDTAIIQKGTVLLDLDVKGSMSIRSLYLEQSFSIFILPPSIDHLRGRLRRRGTDSELRIEKRLQRFEKEMEYKNKFDYVFSIHGKKQIILSIFF